MPEHTAVLAGVATVLVVTLLVRPPARPRPGRGAGRGSAALAPWCIGPPAVAVAVAMPAVVAPVVVPIVVLAVVVRVGWALLVRRRERRAAQEVEARVREVCEQVAADLLAGLAPEVAVAAAADTWPPLAGVVEAARMGADVPQAWRALGQVDGADGLRLVAAAWQVAHRTGQGLGDALDRVAIDLRRARSTQRVVEGELASARATARLMAALPVLALAMGSGAGGDPVGFLLRTPIGLACLMAGAAFALVGLWWIEAIARDIAVGR